GLPGYRRCRPRGELGLADARLDAAALGTRAGHRPADASHVCPADHALVIGAGRSDANSRRAADQNDYPERLVVTQPTDTMLQRAPLPRSSPASRAMMPR